jgi:23S rRNA pseudouridine2605 synthase
VQANPEPSDTGKQRLQKAIAQSGIASRRGAEELIADGKVQVNGHRITEQGTMVGPEDRIHVAGKPLPAPERVVTYLLNKPRGVVCSKAHQGKDTIITELVPDQPAVFSVGRLDKESEGAILLTNDGALAHRLAHPSFVHAKTYRVSVKFEESPIKRTPEWVCQHLLAGVKLGDGKAVADTVTAEKRPDDSLILTLTVHEGRTHLVRRMCATLGLKVTRLKRVAIGSLILGPLKPGAYRRLTPKDLARL